MAVRRFRQVGRLGRVALLLAAGIAPGAPAEEPPVPRPGEPILDCWDLSFNYTVVGIRALEAGGHEVAVATQNRALLAPLLPDGTEGWGPTTLRWQFPPEACLIEADAMSFSCRAERAPGSLAIRSSERPTERIDFEMADLDAALIRQPDPEGSDDRPFHVTAAADGEAFSLTIEMVQGGLCGGSWSAFRE